MKHNSLDLLVVAVITLIAIALAFVVPSDVVPVRNLDNTANISLARLRTDSSDVPQKNVWDY